MIRADTQHLSQRSRLGCRDPYVERLLGSLLIDSLVVRAREKCVVLPDLVVAAVGNGDRAFDSECEIADATFDLDVARHGRRSYGNEAPAMKLPRLSSDQLRGLLVDDAYPLGGTQGPQESARRCHTLSM
jgi:hypothetical protein